MPVSERGVHSSKPICVAFAICNRSGIGPREVGKSILRNITIEQISKCNLRITEWIQILSGHRLILKSKKSRQAFVR